MSDTETARAPEPTTPDTIVLIHGLWMTPRSWEKWVERYSSRGYQAMAPAWPGLDRDIADIRRDPSSLDGLGVTEIVDHYDRIVRGLDRPPIIMGHSFGALFTQLLLDRGLGAAGVAIDSAPARGILRLPFSTLRSAWPALKNPANRRRSFTLSPKQFRYRFGNTMSEEESNAVYEEQCIPGTGRVLFQAGLANFNPSAVTNVDFRRPGRAPFLMIVGEKDHVAPPSIVRANFKKYRRSPSTTEYKEFPGRSHYICGERGWEEVADYALAWVMENATAAGSVVEIPTADTRDVGPSA
jgi:pimeloyl-ACP methyl ester carboxylesterase